MSNQTRQVLSELELALLLFHSYRDLTARASSEDVDFARRSLQREGLIEEEGDLTPDELLTTSRGEAHIDFLLSQELPCRRWIHK